MVRLQNAPLSIAKRSSDVDVLQPSRRLKSSSGGGRCNRHPLSCNLLRAFYPFSYYFIFSGLFTELIIIIIIERGVWVSSWVETDGKSGYGNSGIMASWEGYLVNQKGRECYTHGWIIILGSKRYPQRIFRFLYEIEIMNIHNKDTQLIAIPESCFL